MEKKDKNFDQSMIMARLKHDLKGAMRRQRLIWEFLEERRGEGGEIEERLLRDMDKSLKETSEIWARLKSIIQCHSKLSSPYDNENKHGHLMYQ